MPPASLAEQSLHVMAKPIGPICNLDCTYCYYLKKEELYPQTRQWKMDEATLAAYIRGMIDTQSPEAETIPFAWQGGEPMLLGLDFFRRAVELQNKWIPEGRSALNTLQTNGTLLDEDWCRFFKENGFLIGLSIDGPPDLHDAYRVDKQNRPTFEAVSAALDLLLKHKVDFNALVTVHRRNQHSGRKIYTYLRKRGVRFMQFIPIVEKRGDGLHPDPPEPQEAHRLHRSLVSSRSVDPEAFGLFLLEVFDEWVRRDVGQIYVQTFDEAFGAWAGFEPSLCLFRTECGRALALEQRRRLQLRSFRRPRTPTRQPQRHPVAGSGRQQTPGKIRLGQTDHASDTVPRMRGPLCLQWRMPQEPIPDHTRRRTGPQLPV